MPPNAPMPIGKELIIRDFVDEDFSGNTVTRRYRTGFIITENMSPEYWLSNKQGCIDTSLFGSEFCAMKQCCEYLRGLRYKIQMMGINVDKPCFSMDIISRFNVIQMYQSLC